eukprot:CCRYP_009935-RA/>CCRYP_009935-RA protein AED:0.42 eAED:1.00 QI:0/-1/0/1/-1/0/1/0/31
MKYSKYLRLPPKKKSNEPIAHWSYESIPTKM